MASWAGAGASQQLLLFVCQVDGIVSGHCTNGDDDEVIGAITTTQLDLLSLGQVEEMSAAK